MGYNAKKSSVPAKVAKSPRKASRQGAGLAPESRPHQQQVMHRLRRVEGQIRGILAMMEQEQACDAIAQQLSAARKALDRAYFEMMACSLEMEINGSSSHATLSERITEKTRMMAKYA